MKPGSTGQFPAGRLKGREKDDEGALRLIISTVDGKVCIDYGKPVAWLAMFPDQAISYAEAIITRARAIKHDQDKNN